MRVPLLACALVLLAVAPAIADGEADPAAQAAGWKTTVSRLAGSDRELWHLALVFHRDAREATLVVAPCRAAGREAEGIDAERVERSMTGDLHQIALLAEHLRKEADGWKRPSLRDRPEPSAHVIGVVRAVGSGATVDNAEHGGRDLQVGDLLFVEDVLRVEADGGLLAIELLGHEMLDFRRALRAELVFGAGSRAGLRTVEGDPLLHLHAGSVRGTTFAEGLQIRTGPARRPADMPTTYVPGDDTTFLLARGAADRLDVREGGVAIRHVPTDLVVKAGGSLTLAAGGVSTLAPLDEARWNELAPKEPPSTRTEALRLVEGVKGTWRGAWFKASITLGDDGRWRSHAYKSQRSTNRGGAWEPRPGGLVELTWVWTPHRSRTERTDVFRYLLCGDALRLLEPGGQLYLQRP